MGNHLPAYVSNLKQALAFAVLGFPPLLALLTPAMRGEGPETIPTYFALAVIIIAAMTAAQYAVAKPRANWRYALVAAGEVLSTCGRGGKGKRGRCSFHRSSLRAAPAP